ncbi:hypothetical protein DUI87_15296 [Hirundo rustica rustica]|uniref:Uncharacterized protein n=1 Tax=Hirundo rustica rustica TaxID=333673 RepID=A0A3M0KKU0_HIRRU|nr:hypothetical protein DUI87_15296 [Hirundo rustica rustica]
MIIGEAKSERRNPEEVEDRSRIPEMRKSRCNSACGAKSKDGAKKGAKLMVETPCCKNHFPAPDQNTLD